MGLETWLDWLPDSSDGLDATFITLDGGFASFAGADLAGAKAWWRANARRAAGPIGSDRIVTMLHRATGEFDVVARRPVLAVSMCVHEGGAARPLVAEEARAAYRTDPDTGRLLPPETHLRFEDFETPPDGGGEGT